MCVYTCVLIIRDALQGAQRRIQGLSAVRDLVREQTEFSGGAAMTAATKAGQATTDMMACRFSLLILPRLLSTRLSNLKMLNLSSSTGSHNEWRFLLNDAAVSKFPPCPHLVELVVRNVDLTVRNRAKLSMKSRENAY